MEITKREVLFSVIIIVVMLCVGLLISGAINTALLDKFQEYDTALQIDNDKELFEYGMRTNVGRAFVYGNLDTVDPVTYPEIGGQYAHVEKVKERYTQHTRTVTYTDGDGNTRTRTETYWTWDEVDSWDIRATKITFLGVEFKYKQIPFECDSYIRTIKESSHVRYKYYGTPTSCNGTIYTKLLDKNISDTDFFRNRTISEALGNLESKWQLILFWIVWVLLMGGAVIGFYFIENEWLED